MSETRRRKVPRDENADIKQETKFAESSQQKSRSKFYFLTAMIFTICFGAYFYLFRWSTTYTVGTNLLDSASLKLGLKHYVYSIVIDAGSTGTRILLYRFVSSPHGHSLTLDSEFFKAVKPGISSYAGNIPGAVKSLDNLVSEAKVRIPRDQWHKTSLVMKATAGLRLLPSHQAKALLRGAKEYFDSTGFKVDDDAVAILDGTDEGLLSWFTVNYLLDRLNYQNCNPAVALDLGGGSTQVSFVVTDKDMLNCSHSQYVTQVTAFHNSIDVYSRSYLGLGLNEGRKRILLNGSNYTGTIHSVCINPLVNMQWKYAGVEYNVQGSENPRYFKPETRGDTFATPIVDYEECLAVVKKVVGSFEKAPSLEGKDVYGFSYYHELAAECELVEFKKAGDVTVRQLMAMAKYKCSEANVNQPFLCLDLIYVTTLLTDLYSIPECQKVNLIKWINGHEVSWALGAAFLNLQHQQQRS